MDIESTHTFTFLYIAAKLMYSNKALSKLANGKAKSKPTGSWLLLCIWQTARSTGSC